MNIFVKEQELNEALLKLITNRNSFEEKLLDVIMKQMESQASMFLFDFKGELERNNNFKDLEGLFLFVEEIKEVYNKCIGIFNKNIDKFDSEQIKEILSGIIWNMENVLEEYPKDKENRIELERIRLISNAIQQMKNVFKKSIQEFIDYKLDSNILDFDISKVIEDLIVFIFKNEGSNIKEMHAYSLKNLNILDKRVECKKYINFIIKAKKNLEAYNNIDMDILISQVDDVSNVIILKNIIIVIKELYKKLESKENEVYSIINQSSFSAKIISDSYNHLKQPDRMIKDMIENEELTALVNSFQSLKVSVLEQLAISIMDEMSKAITFTMNEIASESKEVQFLSCNIVESLKQANERLIELNKVMTEEQNEEFELVKVLMDTIKLKYESVKEKDLAYLVRKKENYVSYEKELLGFKVNFHNNIKEYFVKMISESKQYFLNAQIAFDRLANQLINKNNEEDFNYLKADLLFEIVTLEEVVKYCLPKLKASEQVNVLKLVDIIEACYKQIEKNILLAKLEPIEPVLHERFNGKDHEVILVEELVDYKKGEVINVHTKGYKYKGIPVVRANIIAAK